MAQSARRGQVRKRLKKDGTVVWDAIAHEGRGPDGSAGTGGQGASVPSDAILRLATLTPTGSYKGVFGMAPAQ